jgi:hypothetical protein
VIRRWPGAGRVVYRVDQYVAAGYLGLFTARRDELLTRSQPPPTRRRWTPPGGWPSSGSRRSRQPRLSCYICARFPRLRGITPDLLSADPALLPDELGCAVTDPLTLEDATAALYRYWLVGRDDTGLRVHRLVHAVAASGLPARGMHGLDPSSRGWCAVAERMSHGYPSSPVLAV